MKSDIWGNTSGKGRRCSEYETEKDHSRRDSVNGRKRQDEIAEELGLLDQVLEEGWKSLSSKETGRIGGLMTRRRRKSAEDPA